MEPSASHSARWLLLIDAGGVEDVNARHGRARGDDVLRAVAACLEVAVGDAGRTSRIDGHRWALMVTAAEADVTALAADLRRRVSAAAAEAGAGPVVVRCAVGLAEVRGDGRDAAWADAEVALELDRAETALVRPDPQPLDPAVGDVVRAWRTGASLARVDVGVRLQRTLVERRIVGAAVVPTALTAHGPVGPDRLHRLAGLLGVPCAVLDAARAGIAASSRPIPPAGVRLWFEVPARDLVGGAGLVTRLVTDIGLSGMPRGVVLADAGAHRAIDLAGPVAELRRAGVEVAVEALSDVGVGALAAWGVDRLLVGPEHVVAAHAGDEAARRAVRVVVEMALGLGCDVVAVDVPSLEMATTLHDLGVTAAQVATSEPWAAPAPAVAAAS